MTSAFLAGVVAGYGIAVPVGAIGVLLVGLAARAGVRVGAAAALGVAVADGVYALVAVAGGAALAAALAPVAGPLRYAAAVVLLALAAHTVAGALRRRSGAPPRVAATPARAFLALFGLTLLNPATVLYFVALVLGRAPGSGGGAAFVAGAFLASASWQLLLAAGGSLVGRALTGPRARLATALVSAAVVAALAVAVLVA
ncbi:LysE family transporter [Spirilliplanes yamanashiensis]|uniref:Lysine transporter LysE n=1 Tax=Spirilliplanes yamanashiensis TaxID=42233 RepID=A0A8J3Y855_9ACTN|nr:LysE family transporter [Spirilliplanes yamanashiensis]MDP9817102.1 arginine exporter protein ArgO [Spirilliplanes yamanashiensis]GIJ03244.1 lysine transporter LysE [Spirilliplanes yamanashiensis]